LKAGGPALVTGASRGIGRGVALELAARGFDVIATMRDVSMGASLLDDATRLPAGEGTIAIEQLDVTASGALTPPAELAVLVNNAGVELENLPVEETPLGSWRAMFETNVFGAVDVTRRSIPSLRAHGTAVICNITSSSLLVPMPFFAAYRASKAALAAFSESLQAEVAPFGIRVLEVLPGPVASDMLAASPDTPEAERFDLYRAAAERVGEARRAFIDSATPVDVAAGLIVDAILDDRAPLRVACDPIGASLLETWNRTDHEQLTATYLEAFATGDDG
jgi:NAD(P)-dependent dehydrogenase (short-subunit alcohol dehydrogenase family)